MSIILLDNSSVRYQFNSAVSIEKYVLYRILKKNWNEDNHQSFYDKTHIFWEEAIFYPVSTQFNLVSQTKSLALFHITDLTRCNLKPKRIEKCQADQISSTNKKCHRNKQQKWRLKRVISTTLYHRQILLKIAVFFFFSNYGNFNKRKILDEIRRNIV